MILCFSYFRDRENKRTLQSHLAMAKVKTCLGFVWLYALFHFIVFLVLIQDVYFHYSTQDELADLEVVPRLKVQKIHRPNRPG